VRSDRWGRNGRVDRQNLQSLLLNNAEWVSGSKDSFQSKKPWWNTFYKDKANFYQVNEKDFFMVVNPVIWPYLYVPALLALAFEAAPGRVEIARAAANPRVTGYDELLPWHIAGVEGNAERLAQFGAQLGIGESPA